MGLLVPWLLSIETPATPPVLVPAVPPLRPRTSSFLFGAKPRAPLRPLCLPPFHIMPHLVHHSLPRAILDLRTSSPPSAPRHVPLPALLVRAASSRAFWSLPALSVPVLPQCPISSSTPLVTCPLLRVPPSPPSPPVPMSPLPFPLSCASSPELLPSSCPRDAQPRRRSTVHSGPSFLRVRHLHRRIQGLRHVCRGRGLSAVKLPDYAGGGRTDG